MATLATVFLLVVISKKVSKFKLRQQLGQQLEEVNKQIELTEKRIEELKQLTPEQKAKVKQERETLSAQRVTDDVAVEGLKIFKVGNTKTVENLAEGYMLEVPLNLVVARSISSDSIELHDRELMCRSDPLCRPVMRIARSGENARRLSIDTWLAQEEQKAGRAIYSPRKKLVLNGRETYQVTENIPGRFTGFYYYWTKDGRIYSLRISALDEQAYHSSIETLNF